MAAADSSRCSVRPVEAYIHAFQHVALKTASVACCSACGTPSLWARNASVVKRNSEPTLDSVGDCYDGRERTIC